MNFNFRYIFILFLLIIAAVVSWQFSFRDFIQHDTVSIHEFPMQIGEWKGEEIPISEGDLAILETKNAFTRRYSTPSGKEVILYIIYSQTNRKALHPPEICYSGGGISILSDNLRVLSDKKRGIELDTKRMFVEKGKYQQIANYWFKVGNTMTANYLKQQILVALKMCLGRPAGSAMLRISADVKGEQVAEADATIQEFAMEILPILPKYLP